MHIVMVLASRGDGGLEKHVRELSFALVAHNHRVTVVADASFLATLDDSVAKVCFNMQRWRYNPFMLCQLKHTLQRLQPDIVHAHANKATALLASIRFLLKVPCIATLHNLKKSIKYYHTMQAVIAPSKTLAATLNHKNVHVIYHGLSHTSQPKLAPSKTGFCLVAIGRLVPAKGLQTLLAAVDGLALTLKIAGEGPLRQTLSQQIALMSKLTRVELLGHVQDVSNLLIQSDGLVIASHREGFAYVCAEALFAEVPVISTRVPVADELLPSEWLVPVADVSALRAAIERAMHSPAEWRHSQQSVFSYVRAQFSLAHMAEATIAAYQSAQLERI